MIDELIDESFQYVIINRTIDVSLGVLVTMFTHYFQRHCLIGRFVDRAKDWLVVINCRSIAIMRVRLNDHLIDCLIDRLISNFTLSLILNPISRNLENIKRKLKHLLTYLRGSLYKSLKFLKQLSGYTIQKI